MVSRGTVACLLVSVGAVVVVGFLTMAIYSEIYRPRGSEKLAKLILVTAWDKRSPDEEAGILEDAYGAFFKFKLDVEMAYTKDGLGKLVTLEARLNLSDPDQGVLVADGAESLENEQDMFNKLYVWLSHEDTELDKTAETTSKQFDSLSVSSQQLSLILERLAQSVPAPDLLAIEAWPPAEIRIMTLDPGHDALVHLRDSASFDILRKDLCPASGPDDSQCKLEGE